MSGHSLTQNRRTVALQSQMRIITKSDPSHRGVNSITVGMKLKKSESNVGSMTRSKSTCKGGAGAAFENRCQVEIKIDRVEKRRRKKRRELGHGARQEVEEVKHRLRRRERLRVNRKCSILGTESATMKRDRGLMVPHYRSNCL